MKNGFGIIVGYSTLNEGSNLDVIYVRFFEI